MQIAPDIKLFTSHDVPVAVLLEGKFTSLFKNRISKIQIDSLNALGFPFKDTSDHGSQMIVVADGDVAMNQFSLTDGPLPMGMNLYTHYTFANKEFYINALEYLVNPSGILETRAKNYVLRLLDAKKIKEQKSNWQLINIALPVLLVILLGIIYRQTRKKQYE